MSKIAPLALFRMAVPYGIAGLTLTSCGAPPKDKSGEATAADGQVTRAARSGYAPIGPLKMYYELHGTGEPVLLIHGGISTIQTSFGTILPELSRHRQAIAMESQGHGRTADIDRPLTFEQMGEDAAALLRYLRIAKADVIGYSDGGNVALALAMRHPGLVRKVVVMGTNYSNEGLVPEVRKQIEAGAMMPQAEVAKGISAAIPEGLCRRRTAAGRLARAGLQGHEAGRDVSGLDAGADTLDRRTDAHRPGRS